MEKRGTRIITIFVVLTLAMSIFFLLNSRMTGYNITGFATYGIQGAPTITSVEINPSSPSPDDDLIGNVTANDGDGDNMTIAYNWYKDGSIHGRTLITEGLRYYFPFNNDSLDYYGSNDGSAIGGASLTSDGKIGGSHTFDGDADYVQTTEEDSSWAGEDFTISTWVKIPTTVGHTNNKLIVSRHKSVNDKNFQVGMEDDNRLMFSTYPICSGGTPNTLYSTETLQQDTWYHVVYMLDSGTRKYIYLDGVQVVNGTSVTTIPSGCPQKTIIGANLRNNNTCWDGEIDELLIFNRTLSDSEIQQLYLGGKYGGNVVNSSETSEGDEWILGALAGDSTSWSSETNSSVTTIVSNIAPVINLLSPANSSYNYNVSIDLNFNVNDDKDPLGSLTCWYNLDDGSNITLSNCDNSTITPSTGSHTLKIFANDTEGLEGTDSIVFSVVNSAPSLTLVSPSNGSTYGYNESLALDFVVSDSNGDLDDCWYNLDGGSNITLTSCSNTTFDTSEGSHVVYIFANDSEGLESSDEVSFTIDIGAPTIVLDEPINEYLDDGDVVFKYNPDDDQLDSCELWGDFTGSFEKNQTDTNPTSGSENTFNVDGLDEGTYMWNIWCNDTLGNAAFNGNQTFYVDTTNPVVSLSEPTGTKTSRTGISLEWGLTELNEDTCWYNVYRGVSLEVSNTTVNCSLDESIFDVTVDADFVLNFYSNDSAGNFGSDDISFTVDTNVENESEDDSGGSSGGGGSGGTVIAYSNYSYSNALVINALADLILRPGENKKMALNVKNNGKKFLNNCVIKGKEGSLSEGWISSNEVKDLAVGEEHDMVFTLNLPDELGIGKHPVQVYLECQEANQTEEFTVEVLDQSVDFTIVKVERVDNNNILLTYSLKDLSGTEQNLDIVFLVVDENNAQLWKNIQEKIINASALEEFELNIPLAAVDSDLRLLVDFTSEVSSFLIEEDLILASQESMTGFFVWGSSTTDRVLTWIAIGIFTVFVVFMVVRLVKDKYK